jgi:hypothetical protein
MPKQFIQKAIGAVCLVLGLWLLLCGHDVDNSIGSQFSRAFTGSSLGKATHDYIAGIILGLIGAFLIFWKRTKL